MPDHMINVINPKTGDQKLLTLRGLSEFEIERAKRSLLRSSDNIRSQMPDGYMPCDGSFCSP